MKMCEIRGCGSYEHQSENNCIEFTDVNKCWLYLHKTQIQKLKNVAPPGGDSRSDYPELSDGLPSVDDAGAIAVKMSDQLSAEEQSFFVAGFQECIKYLRQTVR